MKIVYIGPMRMKIPSESGAIEEIIWKVSLELRKRSFRVYIYNPVALNIPSKIIKTILLSLYLNDDFILHFHDIFACSSFVSASTTTRKHAILLTFHYPPWITKSKQRFKIMHNLLKYLKNRRVVFAAPSRYIVDWFRAQMGVNALFIPNGVDILMFNPSKRNYQFRERILQNKEVLICYVARIHPDKNHVDLLKATRKLLISGINNFKIILIGPTSGEFKNKKNISSIYFNQLQRLILKYNLQNYIEFLGEVPYRRKVAEILASSDIYVHPAKVEVAPPLALMEAMASGLPVVAYDLPYYLGFLIDHHNSLLVKTGDVDALANSLGILINEPHLRKYLGANARSYVESNLAWEKVVENYYINIYKELFENELWKK